MGGPYPSEQAALQENGGVLPPDAVLLPGKSVGSAKADKVPQWYLVSRASAVTGRDLRGAEPSRERERTTGGGFRS